MHLATCKRPLFFHATNVVRRRQQLDFSEDKLRSANINGMHQILVRKRNLIKQIICIFFSSLCNRNSLKTVEVKESHKNFNDFHSRHKIMNSTLLHAKTHCKKPLTVILLLMKRHSSQVRHKHFSNM